MLFLTVVVFDKTLVQLEDNTSYALNTVQTAEYGHNNSHRKNRWCHCPGVEKLDN